MLSKTKTTTLVLFILLACRATGAAQGEAQGPAWGRYMYPGDEFSVELPGQPFVYRTDRWLNAKQKAEPMRVFGLYSNGAVYMVAAFDKPHSSESFDDFVGYIHSRYVFKDSSKKDADFGGFKGREYSDGARLKYRVFRSSKRAYLVWADGEAAGVARFLNSLTLSPRPEGAEITGAQPDPAATPTPAGGGVDPLKTADVTRKAVLVYKPEPGFTAEAREKNVTGVVRLRVVLSSSGRVKNISVIKGLPAGLTEQAIKAAQHMLFFPAWKDGRAVSQYAVLEYNFNIY